LRLILLFLVISASLYAQNITRAEYFFDTDPGFSNATSIPITSSVNITQGFTVPLGTVTEGFHTLYIRVKDNNGLWSIPVIHPVYVQLSAQSASVTPLTRVEYFFDIDPGFGNGTVIPIANAVNITQGFTVPLGTVSEGFHSLYIRAKDNNGLWSIPVIHPVYVQLSAQSASITPLTRIEYFFNTDPGIGNGIEIPITAAINITRDFTIPLSTIPEGFNSLYIRAKDSNGLWSIPVIHPVFVQRNAQSASTPALIRLEYFIDTDPGLGNAEQVALSTSNVTESFVINLASVPDGSHTLYLRTQDVNGRWSQPLARPFYNANEGSEIVAVEYFYKDIATQTPSELRTVSNFPPAANLTLDFNAVLDGLLPDTNYEIRVTAIDNANKRSKQAVHAFATPAVICDPISPPAVIDAASCGNGSVLLSASGAIATQSYQWYTSLTDVNAIDGITENTFQTPILTDTTAYFVTIQNGTCESDRVQVTAFINPVPAVPTTIDNEACGVDAIITLTASGGNNCQYRWYDVASGGTALTGAINETFNTPPLSATTTYYVSINNSVCESERTPVVATIQPLPHQPIILASTTPLPGNTLSVCSTDILTLNAPNGFAAYTWSNAETTQQITVTTSGTYSVTVTNTNGCISPASDAITITVVPSPCTNSAPVINAATLSTTIGNTVSIDLSTLISDDDNNLVLSSLNIVQQPTSGAQASLNGTTLQINYAGNSFTGTDVITIRACDVFGECTTQQLQINVIGEIEIFNAVSHNNDGKNDFFKILNIELLEPNNTVTIYNRWGSKVFETENYSEVNAFQGLNQNGNELPTGTYFYKIFLKSTRETKTGYLILKK